ncbi:MAG: amidohydrolase, partial [Bacteroidetes bacterium]|nr:amidohydrolase [Bacteroidota bacterium]
MHKIDVHAHILPEFMPNLKEKYGYGNDFIYLDHYQPGRANMMKADGTFFRAIDELWALSTVPVLFYYWAEAQHTYEWSQFINNHLAKIQHT